MVGVERHPRAVGPVVDEAVGVEAGDHLVREPGQQVGAGQRAGVRGVEVAREVVHQHQAGSLGGFADGGLPGEEALGLGEQFDELLRSLGHGRVSSGRTAVRTVYGCSPAEAPPHSHRPPGGAGCGQRPGSSVVGAATWSWTSSAPSSSPVTRARVPSS